MPFYVILEKTKKDKLSGRWEKSEWKWSSTRRKFYYNVLNSNWQIEKKRCIMKEMVKTLTTSREEERGTKTS